MEFFRNLVLFSLLAVGQSFDVTNRILGGSFTSPTDVPYQVSLKVKKNLIYFCGGSILSEDYVLTAAHCTKAPGVVLKPDDVVIHVGIDIKNSISTHNVTSIVRHEQYNRTNSLVNDIALLKVSPPFNFSETVSPVVLPRPHIIVHKIKARVSGWGSTTWPNITHSETLMVAETSVINTEECQRVYETVSVAVYSTHMCTLANDDGIGACRADSGGPLTIGSKMQIGIVSWTYQNATCGSSVYPTVYTRVAEYIDWIKQHAPEISKQRKLKRK